MAVGDLIREYDYDPKDNEPVMRLRPKVTPTLVAVPFTKYVPICFDIPLNLAFLFRGDNEAWVRQYCLMICRVLRLGELTPRRFLEMWHLVQDGLEELIHMPPKECIFDDKPKVIGEGIVIAGGEKFSFDVTDQARDEIEKKVWEDLN